MVETQSRFWKHVITQPGPGLLGLGLLASWKPVADRVGLLGVDLASAVFETVCGKAFASADLSAWLSVTVLGAYWSATDAEREARECLDLLLPLRIESGPHGMSIPVEVRLAFLQRAAGEPAPDLYCRAQIELEGIVAALPPSERYPALGRSWEETVGGA